MRVHEGSCQKAACESVSTVMMCGVDMKKKMVAQRRKSQKSPCQGCSFAIFLWRQKEGVVKKMSVSVGGMNWKGENINARLTTKAN